MWLVYVLCPIPTDYAQYATTPATTKLQSTMVAKPAPATNGHGDQRNGRESRPRTLDAMASRIRARQIDFLLEVIFNDFLFKRQQHDG